MRSLMVRFENFGTAACPKTNPRPPTWGFKMSINVIFCALLDPASGLFSSDFRGKKNLCVFFLTPYFYLLLCFISFCLSLLLCLLFLFLLPLLSSLFSPFVCRSFSSFVLCFLFVNFPIFNPLLAFVLLYMSFSLLSFSFCFSFYNLIYCMLPCVNRLWRYKQFRFLRVYNIYLTLVRGTGSKLPLYRVFRVRYAECGRYYMSHYE